MTLALLIISCWGERHPRNQQSRGERRPPTTTLITIHPTSKGENRSREDRNQVGMTLAPPTESHTRGTSNIGEAARDIGVFTTDAGTGSSYPSPIPPANHPGVHPPRHRENLEGALELGTSRQITAASTSRRNACWIGLGGMCFTGPKLCEIVTTRLETDRTKGSRSHLTMEGAVKIFRFSSAKRLHNNGEDAPKQTQTIEAHHEDLFEFSNRCPSPQNRMFRSLSEGS